MSDSITNVLASTELDKQAEAVRQAQAVAEMKTELGSAGWTAYPDEILADGWRGIIATRYWAKLWVRKGNILHNPEDKGNQHVFDDIYMNPGDIVTERDCTYLFYKRESIPGDASSAYEGFWHVVSTNRREEIN